jgi:HlyD family secretion protein
MEIRTRLGRTGAVGGPTGVLPGGVGRQVVILVGALLGSFVIGWAATSLIVARAGTTTPAAATGARGQAAAVVQTAPATAGSISAQLSYASAVQPTQQVSVAPRAVGVVQDILVDVGQTVHKGDVLAVLDSTNAQAQVQQAQAGLQAAQAKLAQVQAGARPEDIAAAQAQVAQAQARLAGLTGGRPDDVNAAQAQLDAAQAKLDQLQHPLAADVEAAQQSVTSAQAAYDAAVRAAGTDSTQLLSLRAAMEKAAADVQAAQAKYDQVAGRSDIASRPEATALQQATITYQQAKASYDSLAATVDTDGQAKVQAAAAQLSAAKDKLNVLLSPSPQDVAAAQQGVQQAQTALAKAQQPGAATDIQQQQQVVAQMQAQLQLKQAPYTDTDLQAAAAQVAQAQATLAGAQATLDQTQITAPFDGVVAQKLLTPGSVASTATPILTLISPDIEVHTTIEESRVSLVQPGQAVQLSVPAYPGVTFPAHVDSVAPAGDARAHTFDAKIVPDKPDARLKPGMFAQVTITAAQKDNAVLVPIEAVVPQDSGSVVFVVADGRAQAKTVQTGLSDDKQIEITQGVRAGDQVVTLGQNSLRDGQAVQVPGAPGAGGAGQTRPASGQGQGRPAGDANATPGGGSRPGGGAASATPGAGGRPAGGGQAGGGAGN